MATFLREIYEVLGCFSTATHTKMCEDLLRKLQATSRDNLAGHFASALEANKTFAQVECSFIPEERKNDQGTNPVTTAMRALDVGLKVQLSPTTTYQFNFLQREIPHLRAKILGEQENKGWIDYVAHTKLRPILGEIKWKDDKNPFYAFIHLLTYLSEMATSRQIERAVKHHLFGKDILSITSFDLHIFLANFNDRGEKGALIERTRELADAFKTRLNRDHPEAALCLGEVLCLFGTIDEDTKVFSNLGCHWAA